jgi:hypothetical protein
MSSAMHEKISELFSKHGSVEFIKYKMGIAPVINDDLK